MNQQELESLPDITPTLGTVEKEIDGKTVNVPIQIGFAGAIYQKEDDGIYTDRKTGDRWLTGWHLGARVKRRVSAL